MASGNPALMLYAAFGSFTGMYGRGESRSERWRHQVHGAGMLVTGVALGGALAEVGAPAVVVIACVTVFATVGSIVTDHLRLRPGGPFFGIFALGATAMVGPGLIHWSAAAAICAGTAAFCLALSLAPVLGTAGGTDRTSPTRPPSTRTRRSPTSASAIHAVRYAVATGLAGATGLFMGFEHANWAMASAAVPLAVVGPGDELELRAVIDLALHRVAGTLVGLVTAAAVLIPHLGPSAAAVLVMLLLFPTELFMSRSYGIALGFFTPLILIMTDLADPADPVSMLVARAADTVVGVSMAVLAAAVIARQVRS